MPDNNVQFDADQRQFQPRADSRSAGSKGLSAWLIKSGIAKDENGANKAMIVILIANIVLIYLIIHFFL